MERDEGQIARVSDRRIVSHPNYRRIVGDGVRRIGRSGRIVGPLALAATASAGCDGRFVVSGVIVAGLVGFITYLRLNGRHPKAAELPSHFRMYNRGIADDVWHLYLKELVKASGSNSIIARKGRLVTKEGAELSLMQQVVRSLLRLSPEESRRAVFAAASREYRVPRYLSDLPGMLEWLDDIAYTVDPAFKSTTTVPIDVAQHLGLSSQYYDLLYRMYGYSQSILELADVYEPALLARYYAQCGHMEAAQTMLNVLTDCIDELRSEDISSLFEEIPDLQMLSAGVKARFGLPRALEPGTVNVERNMVASMLHMYFARTLAENVLSGTATGIAQRHVEAAEMLIGADYSGDIAAVMDNVLKKPPMRVVQLPSLASGSASWKINLAGMTLAQLRLRA